MKTLGKGALALGLMAVLSVGVNAQAKKDAPKTMKCPYCPMQMGTKKTKEAPLAVKIKGTTYYCCTHCAPKKPAKKG